MQLIASAFIFWSPIANLAKGREAYMHVVTAALLTNTVRQKNLRNCPS